MKKCTKPPIVHISNHQSKYRVGKKLIEKLTQICFDELNWVADLEIAFVSDPQIRRVNKLFHGTDAPTDVLAFETPTGEIIISVDHVINNSKRFKVSPDEELMRYVIHGVLHLLGERDHSKRLRNKMFHKQETLLKKISPVPKLIKG